VQANSVQEGDSVPLFHAAKPRGAFWWSPSGALPRSFTRQSRAKLPHPGSLALGRALRARLSRSWVELLTRRIAAEILVRAERALRAARAARPGARGESAATTWPTGLVAILHEQVCMRARRPWLLAVSAWWSRHRRRWRRRHLRAVEGGARRPFGDRALRPPRDPRTTPASRTVDPTARWSAGQR